MNTQKKILSIFLMLFLVLNGFKGLAQEKKISLEEAKSMALQNNKKLRQAQKNIEAAQAASASANAGGKPTIDGSVTGLYLSDPLKALLPEYQASGMLSVSQVLYAGGKVQNAKKLSASAVDLQSAQKALTEDEVLLNVVKAYWQVVSAKEKNVLAKEYIRLLNALHTTLKNSFDAGLIYKNDLLKVDVQRNEADLNLTRAEDGLTMAKLNLAQITGQQNTDYDVNDDVSVAYTLVSEADRSSIEKRPEVAMLNKAVEIQELQTELLKGNRRPTIGLSANGIAAFGKQINFGNGNNNLQAFVGLVSVNVPIFDWGGRKQKVKEQQFKTDAQRLELEETKELLGLEVKNAWLQLRQSVKRIELMERSLQQAMENLRLNQDRFNAGTVLGEDVLEAQVLWQQANSNLIDAKVEYRVNEVILKKAMGEL
ncbi:TolC family protein [Sphingobacterium olei]|uniref:TolC family protein n=1 Tax=Sphingobacterium olei TaxID=2571155 RepID=A0A4U0NHM3_9SPHI|nr:TolC family protein [Sphingobacterium olei]TJZ53705.1 TolC family protein [Sphingobacterium olei]